MSRTRVVRFFLANLLFGLVCSAALGQPPKETLPELVNRSAPSDYQSRKQGASPFTGPNNQMKQTKSVAPNAHREILNLFPPSTVKTEPSLQGQSKLKRQFSGVKSLWAEGLDERKVFHGEMIHDQDQDNSYTLRIGKGGQVYSLRGPFGESVPPSWRKKDGKQSPWNDEVWQFVAVCTKYNGLDHAKRAGKIPKQTVKLIEDSEYAESFFVHNSGAYIPQSLDFDSLYCPLLSSELDKKDRSFRMLNWGLVPQIKTIHRSPILFYTQVRDAGNGVIELTWVVHNFSVHDDVVFDHLNAPWGGTRISSLPFRYVSAPDGSLLERKDVLSSMGVVKARKTAGWNLSCAGEDSDSPTLALVYGRDKHLESERKKKNQGKPYAQFSESLYRDWRARASAYEGKGSWKDWKTLPANSFRNYDVCEVIPKLRIAPGTSIWYRSFLVVGPKDKVIKQSSDLVEHVDYGLLEFGTDKTKKINVSINGDKITTTTSAQKTGKQFSVFARPVAGTKPLFLIQNSATGQEVVTTDPYVFVPQEKLDLQFPQDHSFSKYYSDAIGYRLDEGISQWKAMLGFGYEQKPDHGNWVQLSSLLDKSKFPAATKFHLDLWVEVPN